MPVADPTACSSSAVFPIPASPRSGPWSGIPPCSEWAGGVSLDPWTRHARANCLIANGGGSKTPWPRSIATVRSKAQIASSRETGTRRISTKTSSMRVGGRSFARSRPPWGELRRGWKRARTASRWTAVSRSPTPGWKLCRSLSGRSKRTSATDADDVMSSTREMLAASPVAFDLDLDAVAEAVDRSLAALQACTSCSDASLAEDDVADAEAGLGPVSPAVSPASTLRHGRHRTLTASHAELSVLRGLLTSACGRAPNVPRNASAMPLTIATAPARRQPGGERLQRPPGRRGVPGAGEALGTRRASARTEDELATEPARSGGQHLGPRIEAAAARRIGDDAHGYGTR